MSAAAQMSQLAAEHEFAITRSFDAPRTLVWQCFTEPERMKEWWGPKGSTIVASKMDLRVGGIYHGAMRDPTGRVMWAKFVYREIVVPERLVWEHSFSDETGALTRHPLNPTWPLKLLTTVTFDATVDGKTKVTLVWSPLDASEEERQTFAAAHNGMKGGWTGTFDQLAAYLDRTKAATDSAKR
jgi:uncharacterized protein YndB with AHSA1/START domain